jgi:hypothetical protein
MLPSSRVIGHREYGNTPPGGWAGRKTDPVYDMNWRRQQVADFTPNSPEEDDVVTEQDKIDIANKVAELIPGRVWDVTARDGITTGNLLGMAAMADRVPGRVWDVTGAEGKRMGQLLDMAALGSRVIDPVVAGVVGAVSKLPGVDPTTLELVRAAASSGVAEGLANLRFEVTSTPIAEQDKTVDAGPVTAQSTAG